MTVTAIEKITVPEFVELDDFEDGFFFVFLNGEIAKRYSPSTDHQRASLQVIYFRLITSSQRHASASASRKLRLAVQPNCSRDFVASAYTATTSPARRGPMW